MFLFNECYIILRAVSELDCISLAVFMNCSKQDKGGGNYNNGGKKKKGILINIHCVCEICFSANLLFLSGLPSQLCFFFPDSLFFFPFCLTVCIGLAPHVCNLLIETVALYLEADDKSSTKTANALLLSLLDILHCMLMFTTNIVRQTLQVWSSFPGGDNHLKHFFRYLLVMLLVNLPLLSFH